MKRRQALVCIAGLASLAGCSSDEEPTTQPDHSVTLVTDAAELTVDIWVDQVVYATPKSVSTEVSDLWLAVHDVSDSAFADDPDHYFWGEGDLTGKREIDPLYAGDKIVLRTHTESGTQTDIGTAPEEGVDE